MRIRIKKKFKIETACSTDETRPGILQPWIHDQRAVATNGRILASVPIDAEPGQAQGWGLLDLDGRKMPVEALKAARKASGKLWEHSVLDLTAETHVGTINGASYPVAHYDVVTPKLGEILACKTEREDSQFTVSVDVALLAKLADALGNPKVTLCFRGPADPITVFPQENVDRAFGLLMPMRVS